MRTHSVIDSQLRRRRQIPGVKQSTSSAWAHAASHVRTRARLAGELRRRALSRPLPLATEAVGACGKRARKVPSAARVSLIHLARAALKPPPPHRHSRRRGARGPISGIGGGGGGAGVGGGGCCGGGGRGCGGGDGGCGRCTGNSRGLSVLHLRLRWYVAAARQSRAAAAATPLPLARAAGRQGNGRRLTAAPAALARIPPNNIILSGLRTGYHRSHRRRRRRH